jgi:peptidyl-prolyl cis-trans isomerase C
MGMNKTLAIFSLALGAFVPGLYAQGAAPIPADRVVLDVGGFTLTKQQFETLLASVPEQNRNADTKKNMLDNITSILQMAQEARSTQFDKDPNQVFQAKFRAEQELATAYLVQRVSNAADEKFLRGWYEQHKDHFNQFKARHVLIRMQGSPVPARTGMKDLTDAEALAKAKAVRAKLVAGGNFAAIAKADSDDSGSNGNGGDLGYFGAGDMVPQIEEAAGKLKVNEFSEPVKTEFGYHVIQLQGTRAKPFEDVKGEIAQQSRGDLQRQFIEGVAKKYPAKTDAAYFGQ